jgi:hypothetical protein
VADEDLVLDPDAVADEGVALDLAAGTDLGTALDLDERADLRAVADPTAIEVRERVDDDVRAAIDLVYEPVRRFVTGSVSHAIRMPRTGRSSALRRPTSSQHPRGGRRTRGDR